MEGLEQIYYWTGFIIIWLLAILGAISIVTIILIQTFNELGKHYKNLWAIVEYAYHRHDFKDWVKYKDRHPKMKILKACQDCKKEIDDLDAWCKHCGEVIL